MNLFSLWFYLKYVLSHYLWGWNLEGFLNKLYVLQSHKKNSPSSTAFQTVLLHLFLPCISKCISISPACERNTVFLVHSCWEGYNLTINFQILYRVSLTFLSWQPNFVIVPLLGAAFRELPAVSSGFHPHFLHPGRKAACCKGPVLEPPLQRWIPVASKAEWCHSQG